MCAIPLRENIMEPTRIELDLPVTIVNQYGHLVLDNLKDVQDIIAASFHKGSVITVHVIAEDTGTTRGFCKHINQSSTYKSECGFVLRPDGSCWRKDEHAKDDAKQLELAEAEDSE
jgi:hypothetical protein